MEHKLLLGGGEHWLAFARSKIKAVRAAGVAYATQRYEMPDGAEVTIRVVGEQEYIYIDGANSVLLMDSGLVDVRALGIMRPERYLPGTLNETNYVAGYNAPFVPRIGYGGAYKDMRWNLPAIPAHQMSGRVSYPGPRFVGHVPVDKQDAMSFAPLKEKVAPATTYTYAAADDFLYEKKLMVVGCPASVFTGRCRLYVQAMYGRPTYIYTGEHDGKLMSTGRVFTVVQETSAAPAMWIPAYVAPDDFDVVNGVKVFRTYPEIMIDTGTGVYFDPATGGHWITTIGGSSQVTTYPLKAPASVEALRKFLIQLAPEDAERLETYILAQCLPDVKNKKVIGTNPFGRYSMGYGWHWNWDGLEAVIIENEQYSATPADDTSYVMRSSYRKLTLTPGVSVTFQTLEDKVVWGVPRVQWCITEPDFLRGVQVKTTPQRGHVQICDAPFYAFYSRNELKVCRISVVKGDEQVPSRTMTKNYSNRPACNDYSGTMHVTYYDQSGYLEDSFGTVGNDPVATFRIGGYLSQKLYQERLTYGARYDVTGFSYNGSVTGGFGFTPFTVDWQTVQFGDSYDTPGFFPTRTLLYGRQDNGFWMQYTMRFRSRTTSQERTSWAAAVVPMYDSEAIYLWTDAYQSDNITGGTDESLQQGAGYGDSRHTVIKTELWDPVLHTYIGTGPQFETFGWSGLVLTPAAVLSNVPAALENNVQNDIRQHLHCHAGDVVCTFPPTGAFFSNELEDVEYFFGALSGTAKDGDAVAVSLDGFFPSVGIDGVSFEVPALVGWV